MTKILYVQYTNPADYPSLEHSSTILAGEGWRVLFLGTSSVTGHEMQFKLHPQITVKRMSYCPGGWKQKFHYLAFALWVIGWTLWWRPRWVYASDVLACPVAWFLNLILGVQVVYHEHDSPTNGNGVLLKKSGFMRFALWARRKLAARATFCIVPNQDRAERFCEDVGNRCKVFTIWNCPTRDEVAPERLSRNGASLRLIYHGSIVPPRLSETVFEALTLLPRGVILQVTGYETVGHEGYLARLKKTVNTLGLGNRVEFLGPLPRYELIPQCREGDVGMVLMTRKSEDLNFRYMVGASNKPFDYLACGLALLVSDLPDWKKIYVEPGYGLACDPENPKSIARAIEWLLDHPEEMRAMGERGRQRVLQDWNYEKQFSPVLQELISQPNGPDEI